MARGSVLGWIRDWWLGRATAAELASMQDDDLRRVSADLGMWAGDLKALAERGPHAADLLGRRLASVDVDIGALTEASPRLVQDMQRVCAFCDSKGICEHDLEFEGGVVPSYCPNAELLRTLIDGSSAI